MKEGSLRNKKEGLPRMLEIAGRGKFKLIFSTIFSVFSAAAALVPFIVIYYMSYELLSPTIDKSYVWMLAWIALAAAIFRFLFQYLSIVLSHIAAYDILYGLRRQLVEHLADLPMGYFTNSSSGRMKKILNDDVEEIELFIGHHIPDIVTAITLPLLTIIFLFFQDWLMAVIALIPLFLAYWAQRAAYAEDGDLIPKYHMAMEVMNSTIIEYVRGMPVIKVFNQTVQSFERFKGSVEGFKNLCLQWSKKTTSYYAIYLVLISSALFFILPAGVWLYIQGSLNISVFILFLLLGIGYAAPLIRIADYTEMMVLIKEGVKRIDGILEQPGVEESAHPRIPQAYGIEFKNVSFAYDSDEYVLRNINLCIKENSVTALVGPSGAGKTTIAQLIPRFWDISEGEILIGGINVKDIPFEELMKKVSLVFQDVFLFNDTIFENIRMGIGKGYDDIKKAAEIAQANDFIESLPEGYHTVFGTGGAHLSGGEQQRISVARAILKNTPIVILDEATAFADPENESKIQKAFSELMCDKTVVVIAHRLSTIKNADQILVIDEGRVQDCGTHHELLERGGLYKNMWEAHISAQDWKFTC
jgi:ATP-binding cassette subfamily B protein